jgi:hypothetical protein
LKTQKSGHIELEKDNKVRDHDHCTSQYGGAACNKCNLNLNLPKFVPICIHNLKYDSKLFLRWILKLRNIYEKNKKKEINIIPNTKENFITFSVKVVVDQYKQRNNYSKCIKCKTEYKNKIVTKCEKCTSKTNIKRKGDMNNELMELRFIDTYRFMDSSLDTLVNREMYCSKCQSRKEISSTASYR